MIDGFTTDVSADGHHIVLVSGELRVEISPEGSPGALESARRAVVDRFARLLDELASEADGLDAPAAHGSTPLATPAARRMWRAVRGFVADGATPPRVAFDGAIAEEVLAAALDAAQFDRVHVVCGSATALHLTPGFGFRALAGDGSDEAVTVAALDLRANDPVRGLSARRIRLGSGGSAGATVLAPTAAKATAAAASLFATVDQGTAPVEALEHLAESANRLVATGLAASVLVAAAGSVRSIGSPAFVVGDTADLVTRTPTPRRVGRRF